MLPMKMVAARVLVVPSGSFTSQTTFTCYITNLQGAFDSIVMCCFLCCVTTLVACLLRAVFIRTLMNTPWGCSSPVELSQLFNQVWMTWSYM